MIKIGSKASPGTENSPLSKLDSNFSSKVKNYFSKKLLTLTKLRFVCCYKIPFIINFFYLKLAFDSQVNTYVHKIYILYPLGNKFSYIQIWSRYYLLHINIAAVYVHFLIFAGKMFKYFDKYLLKGLIRL